MAAIVLSLALGCLILSRLPALVSGPDGGNWLAQAGDFEGRHANAASTVYPPGFLLVLFAWQQLAAPLDALRYAGALVSVLPGLGCYALLRALRAGQLALIGVCASVIGFSLEMLAWGGYPQLLGTALAVAAVAALAAAYRVGSRPRAVLAGCLAALTLLTHQLAGLQVLICFTVASAGALLSAGGARRDRLVQALTVLAALAVTSLPGVPIYAGLLTQAGPSAFNANGFDGAALVAYLTNDAPGLWPALGVCVVLAAAVLALERNWLDVSVLLGLTAASLGLTLLTLEVRAMYLGQLLALVSVGVLSARVFGTGGRVWRAASIVLACGVCLAIGSAGMERLDRSVRFYAVLDPSLVEGFTWLADHHAADDVAAVTPGRGKWPLGWWVQGLGHVPSYLDYDPRWLYFQEEKRQSAIAREILDDADPQAAAEMAQQHGITLLVFDAREVGPADAWLRGGRVFGPIGLIYSNPSLAIFRVAHPVAA